MAASIDLALSKVCENCGDPFLAEKRIRRFCSRSCSSSFSNRKRWRTERKQNTNPLLINIPTGERFGRLVVVGRNSENTAWLCKCDCGNEVTSARGVLVSGRKKSCGCLKLENSERRYHPTHQIIWSRYLDSAARRNIVWELTKDQFTKLVTGDCFYCGQEPIERTATVPFFANGIDRIDSNLGYCIENVVSCCSPCNKAKGTLSQKEFIAWLDRLVEYRLKGDSNGC